MCSAHNDTNTELTLTNLRSTKVTEPVFYVKDVNYNLVPATYLTINGNPVANTNPPAVNEPLQTTLYNLDGSLNSDQNPNNYLIVPVNYNIDSAIQAGQAVAALQTGQTPVGGTIALPMQLVAMSEMFIYGTQDLQRSYEDLNNNIITGGPAVPAFINAASFNLGIVTAAAGLPLSLSAIGGGLFNEAKILFGANLDNYGSFLNSTANTNSMNAGYAEGSSVLLGSVHCFPAGTRVAMFDGSVKTIEHISIGDVILAFNSRISGAPLCPARVKRVFSNQTKEWLVLRPAAGFESVAELAGFDKLVVTSGHRFWQSDGTFMRIDEIMATSSEIILAEGAPFHITSERIVFSQANAHLFERSQRYFHATQGAVAVAPQIEEGWSSYNFEVEDLHTYIAGGVRVHNDSLGDLMSAEIQFQQDTGQAFDPNNSTDVAQLASDIANGTIDGGSLATSIGANGDLGALESRISNDQEQVNEAGVDGNGNRIFTDTYGDTITVDSSNRAINETTPVDTEGDINVLAYGYAANGAQYVSSAIEQDNAGNEISGTIYAIDSSTVVVQSSATTFDDGSVTTTSYDNGLPTNVASIAADGSSLGTTTYSYNSNQQLVGEIDQNPDGMTDTITYGADTLGNTEIQGQVETNASNQVLSTVGYASDGSETENDYDPDTGLLTVSTYAASTGASTQAVYTYNSDGSVTADLYDEDANNVSTIQYASVNDLNNNNPESASGVSADGKPWSVDYTGSSPTATYNGESFNLGSQLGSGIGAALAGGSPLKQLVGGTIAGLATGELAQLIVGDQVVGTLLASNGASSGSILDQALGISLAQAAGTPTPTIGGAAGGFVEGQISSFLTAELAQALGLKGFAAGAFDTVGTTITKSLVNGFGTWVAGKGSADLASTIEANLADYVSLDGIEGQLEDFWRDISRELSGVLPGEARRTGRRHR